MDEITVLADHYFTYESRLASFQMVHKRAGATAKAKPQALVWPHKTIAPAELAKAGFFFHPLAAHPDQVACFLCHKFLDGWEAGDNPAEEHLEHAADCGWAKLIAVEMDVRGLAESTDPMSAEMLDARKMTFAGRWPHDGKRGWKCKTKQMVEAGWHYTPLADSTDMAMCAYCHLGLDGWEAGDKPLNEHYNRSPNCAFFMLAAENQTAPKKTAGRKPAVPKPSSRASIQSSSTFDGPSSVVDMTVDDIADLSVGRKPGRTKKAPAKPRKGRVKKEDSEVDEDSVSPPPQPVQAPPPAKTSGRGRKRGSEAVEEPVVAVAEAPAAKKRATKGRPKAADANVLSQVDELAEEEKPVEKKPMPNTNRKVSDVSMASEISRHDIPGAFPRDDSVQEDDKNAVMKDVVKTTPRNKSAYTMFDATPGLFDEDALDGELRELQETMGVGEGDKEGNGEEEKNEEGKEDEEDEMDVVGGDEMDEDKEEALDEELDDIVGQMAAEVDYDVEEVDEQEGEVEGDEVEGVDEVEGGQEEEVEEDGDEVDQIEHEEGEDEEGGDEAEEVHEEEEEEEVEGVHEEEEEEEVEGIHEEEEGEEEVEGAPDEQEEEEVEDVHEDEEEEAEGEDEGEDEDEVKGIHQDDDVDPLQDEPHIEPLRIQKSRRTASNTPMAVDPKPPIEQTEQMGLNAYDSAASTDTVIKTTRKCGRPGKIKTAAEENGAMDVDSDQPHTPDDRHGPTPATDHAPTTPGNHPGIPLGNLRELPSHTPPSKTDRRKSPSTIIKRVEMAPLPTSTPKGSPLKHALLPTSTPKASPLKNQIIPAGRIHTHSTPWREMDLDAVFAGFNDDEDELVTGTAWAGRELSVAEMEMTVEQWVLHNAASAEARMRDECEAMVSQFESEGGRALKVLEGLVTD